MKVPDMNQCFSSFLNRALINLWEEKKKKSQEKPGPTYAVLQQ